MKVVVVGGGVAGLGACAQLGRLSRNLVSRVTLITGNGRDPSTNLSTGLWSPALRALRRLGVLDEVVLCGRYLSDSGYKVSDQHDPTHWLMRPSRGVDSRGDISLPSLLFIKNSDLLNILQIVVKECPLATEVVNDGVIGVGPSAVTTQGGESIEYDLLIAADGSRSTVRTLTEPKIPPVSYRGYHVFRGSITRDVVEATFSASSALLLSNQAWQSFGPGCRFAVVPTTTGYQWFAAVTMSPPSKGNDDCGPLGNATRTPSAAELATLTSALEQFHEPCPALIRHTAPQDLSISPAFSSSVSTLSQASPGKSKVVYLGDANFTIDPILAVGAGVALEESVLLATAIVQSGSDPYAVSRALETNHQRRDRLLRLAVLSDLAQLVGHVDSSRLCRIRNWLLGILPTGATGAALDSLIRLTAHSTIV